jgi:deoxyribonuclease V
VRYVAGIDAAYDLTGRECLAAAVLWDLDAQEVLEVVVARRRLTFPYVPGLLSFREAPAVLAALRKLRRSPHAVICDGHGLAHPRRFGLACHVGVIVDLPTVGCAKSRLVGSHREPGRRRGARVPLVHRDQTVGAVLRTRDNTRPVFVSAGHRIDVDSAVHLVMACGAGYRLPEPTRLADREVARAKRR